MSTRCNRCYLEDLQKLASSTGGHVVIQLAQRHGDALFFGYDIAVLYPMSKETAWSMWFDCLHNRCTCGS